ncbi:MAG: lysophospholipid acyltransferase family protein [Thermaerobacterales bacterium]
MILYRIVRRFFGIVLYLVYGARVQGRQHVPATGPVLICANHISWWDPPLVGAGIRRPIHFMAKEELYDTPIIGKLLPRVGTFPVRRGRADRRALAAALGYLAAGRMVGMFIEGTRSKTGEPQEAQPGAAWIAIRGKVPVVPVAIFESYRPFTRVYMRIGEPIELKEYYDRKVNSNDLAEAGQQIMNRITALMPERLR